MRFARLRLRPLRHSPHRCKCGVGAFAVTGAVKRLINSARYLPTAQSATLIRATIVPEFPLATEFDGTIFRTAADRDAASMCGLPACALPMPNVRVMGPGNVHSGVGGGADEQYCHAVILVGAFEAAHGMSFITEHGVHVCKVRET